MAENYPCKSSFRGILVDRMASPRNDLRTWALRLPKIPLKLTW